MPADSKEWRKQDKRMGRGDTALAVACLGGDERYSMVELLSNEQYGAETINMASQVHTARLMRCRAAARRATHLITAPQPPHPDPGACAG